MLAVKKQLSMKQHTEAPRPSAMLPKKTVSGKGSISTEAYSSSLRWSRCWHKEPRTISPSETLLWPRFSRPHLAATPVLLSSFVLRPRCGRLSRLLPHWDLDRMRKRSGVKSEPISRCIRTWVRGRRSCKRCWVSMVIGWRRWSKWITIPTRDYSRWSTHSKLTRNFSEYACWRQTRTSLMESTMR